MKLLRFGIVSGMGWCIDFAVFSGLLWLGLHAFIANSISATCAITYVFFVSVHRVFEHNGQFIWGKFFCYSAYQVLAISLASWTIAALCQWLGLMPLVSKVLVTPFTFYSNFIFMSLLVERRLRLF